MAAGIDTTGDALCFLMWELSQPTSMHCQRRLQEELRANPGASFDKLPYLDAVVMEGLRCFPAIPMSLPRYVPAGGRTIDGFFLPGGTTVSCQAYSTGRIDTNVFPNPDAFLPDRWLEPEGDAERKRLFFAFASGGRGCIGKQYVYLQCHTTAEPTLITCDQPGARRNEDVTPGRVLQVYYAAGCNHGAQRHGDVGPADLVAPAGPAMQASICPDRFGEWGIRGGLMPQSAGSCPALVNITLGLPPKQPKRTCLSSHPPPKAGAGSRVPEYSHPRGGPKSTLVRRADCFRNISPLLNANENPEHGRARSGVEGLWQVMSCPRHVA